jgi:hypothetical protein
VSAAAIDRQAVALLPVCRRSVALKDTHVNARSTQAVGQAQTARTRADHQYPWLAHDITSGGI